MIGKKNMKKSFIITAVALGAFGSILALGMPDTRLLFSTNQTNQKVAPRDPVVSQAYCSAHSLKDIAYGYSQTMTGPSSHFSTNSVARGHDEATYLGGFFTGQNVDFNPDPEVSDLYSSAGFKDLYITRFNADGSYAWTLTAGGATTHDGVSAMEISRDNNLIVAGIVTQVSEVFGHSIEAQEGSMRFVASISPEGAVNWLYQRDSSIRTLAISPKTGQIAIAGNFKGQVDFNPMGGGDIHDSLGPENSIFDTNAIAATILDRNGNYLQTLTWSDPAERLCWGNCIAFGPDSSLHLVGMNKVSLTEYEVFVTKLNSALEHAWTFIPQGVGTQSGGHIAVDCAGTIYVASSFHGEYIDLNPGGDSGLHLASPGHQPLLFALNGAGQYNWSIGYVNECSYCSYPITAVAVDKNKNLLALKQAAEGTNLVTVGANGVEGMELSLPGNPIELKVSLLNDILLAGTFAGSNVDLDPTEGEDLFSSPSPLVTAGYTTTLVPQN